VEWLPERGLSSWRVVAHRPTRPRDSPMMGPGGWHGEIEDALVLAG